MSENRAQILVHTQRDKLLAGYGGKPCSVASSDTTVFGTVVPRLPTVLVSIVTIVQ